MGDHIVRRPVAARRASGREAAAARAAAADLQQKLPGWLILWGPWRRCYTAFGVCTATATVIDAPTPEALVRSVQEAQLAAHTMQERVGGRPLLH